MNARKIDVIDPNERGVVPGVVVSGPRVMVSGNCSASWLPNKTTPCMICDEELDQTALIHWQCQRGPEAGKQRKICWDCIFDTANSMRLSNMANEDSERLGTAIDNKAD